MSFDGLGQRVACLIKNKISGDGAHNTESFVIVGDGGDFYELAPLAGDISAVDFPELDVFGSGGHKLSVGGPGDARDSLLVNGTGADEGFVLPVPDGETVVVVFSDGEQLGAIGTELE